MASKIRIGKDVELSVTPGSIVTTNATNEQQYTPPGAANTVLTSVSGVPTWSVAPDFWRDAATGLVLPDGVTDYTEQIKHNSDIFLNQDVRVGNGNGNVVSNTVLGNSVASSNTGTNCTLIGFQAGATNSQTNLTAVGSASANSNSGLGVTAVGASAANANAGNYAIAIGQDSATLNTGHTGVFIGKGSGANNSGDDNISIGENAGGITTASHSVMIGKNTGNIANMPYSVYVGFGAGSNIAIPNPLGGSGIVAIGNSAAANAVGVGTIAIGEGAMLGSTSVGGNTIAIGSTAGGSCDAESSIFVGYQAGQYTFTTVDSIGIGTNALDNAYGLANMIGIGSFAGRNNGGADVVLVGVNAGEDNTGDNIIAIGTHTAKSNTAKEIIAFGKNTGYSNTGEDNIFIGTPLAGNITGIYVPLVANFGSTGEKYGGKQSIGIGPGALFAGTGDTVLALGSHAGMDVDFGVANTLNNQFIVSNANLPSFANRAAAVAAITVVLGAAPDNTYLYYNQATFAIEGVRL